MELLAGLIFGGLIIWFYANARTKVLHAYDRLLDIPNITVSGKPTVLFRNYVVLIRHNKIHYEICDQDKAQKLIDSVPAGEPYAVGEIDFLEVFRTPDDLRQSEWGINARKRKAEATRA